MRLDFPLNCYTLRGIFCFKDTKCKFQIIEELVVSSQVATYDLIWNLDILLDIILDINGASYSQSQFLKLLSKIRLKIECQELWIILCSTQTLEHHKKC